MELVYTLAMQCGPAAWVPPGSLLKCRLSSPRQRHWVRIYSLTRAPGESYAVYLRSPSPSAPPSARVHRQWLRECILFGSPWPACELVGESVQVTDTKIIQMWLNEDDHLDGRVPSTLWGTWERLGKQLVTPSYGSSVTLPDRSPSSVYPGEGEKGDFKSWYHWAFSLRATDQEAGFLPLSPPHHFSVSFFFP